MKIEKLFAGHYVCEKWIISKRWGNWWVTERSGLHEVSLKCFTTFKEAKTFVSEKEAK